MKEEIVLCGGKYRFYIDELNVLRCSRHGENWRDFIGDNAVLALFRECLELEGKLEDIQLQSDDQNLNDY